MARLFDLKVIPIHQPSWKLAAALLTLAWAPALRCEPFSVTPEQVSFAYSKKGSGREAHGTQSLSSILKEGAPSYVSTPAKDLRRVAAGAAWQHNLPVTFFVNLIQQESSFQKFAISRAGAVGIAQFMPSVAIWRGLENPFEPDSALVESARYLAELRNEFGNIGLAAAAYNAGPGRLRSWLERGRPLPAETRLYVLAVTGTPIDKWTKSADQPIPPSNSATSILPKTRQTRRPIARSMPQPSQFAIGKPVPPEILASERAVLARRSWKVSASR